MKPHLRYIDGCWYCTDVNQIPRCFGYGPNVTVAYWDWKGQAPIMPDVPEPSLVWLDTLPVTFGMLATFGIVAFLVMRELMK